MVVSLVTGGAGFIGSHLVDYLLEQGEQVLVMDKLTYAANLNNLEQAQKTGRLEFVKSDICNTDLVLELMQEHRVTTVYHLAAESHVDNSIHNSDEFIRTNLVGTCSMLNSALSHWKKMATASNFRFVHVSTDEVFGSLSTTEAAFTEQAAYAPNSPYSASKAGSDHLARAWHATYGLPVIVTHCSNNFGTRQHREKLIPTIIQNALSKKPIPIYGTGKNIRDWIFVKDHCRGLYLAAQKGKMGESYCFGGDNERQNLDLAHSICKILDELASKESGGQQKSYADQITLVQDRLGHDWRYAIDFKKATDELGYQPQGNLHEHLKSTIVHYLGVFSKSQDQAAEIGKTL